MRMLKGSCFAVVIVITLVGCGGSSTSSQGGGTNDGGGNNSGGDNGSVKYSLSVSTAPSGGGSVSPSSGSYDEGSEVTVEATPNEGWSFNSWTGDMESGDNPLTFTINSDTDLTANFDDRRSIYSLSMIATNTTDTVDLGFGQAEGATEGYDNNRDEEVPPPPPSGALNAYFEINDLDLLKDYRSNLKQQVEWTLNYQVDSGEDFKLGWTVTDGTQADGALTLTDKNGSFEVDMFNKASHTVSGTTSGTLIINYNLK